MMIRQSQRKAVQRLSGVVGTPVGSTRYFAADPGPGFIKADGSPFSPTKYPALAAATPRALGSKIGLTGINSGYAQKGIAYGNGVWVTVSGAGNVLYSTDGVKWTQGYYPYGGDATCVIFGGGQFVLGASGAYCFTSPDGINWTYRSLPETNQTILTLAYGNGMYVMGKGNGVYLRSTDAITWTYPASMPNVGSAYYYAMTFAQGMFVAVACTTSASASIIWSSPDGINWTQKTIPRNSLYFGVIWGNGVWVLLDSNYATIWTSPDLTTWTQRSGPNGNAGYAISWGDGLYFQCNQIGVYSSPDLVTWTNRTPSTGPLICQAAFFADGRHVVGYRENTVAFSNYCTPVAAEGVLANGQSAIPYMKAA